LQYFCQTVATETVISTHIVPVHMAEKSPKFCSKNLAKVHVQHYSG